MTESVNRNWRIYFDGYEYKIQKRKIFRFLGYEKNNWLTVGTAYSPRKAKEEMDDLQEIEKVVEIA